jgi:hypothetical protein
MEERCHLTGVRIDVMCSSRLVAVATPARHSKIVRAFVSVRGFRNDVVKLKGRVQYRASAVLAAILRPKKKR